MISGRPGAQSFPCKMMMSLLMSLSSVSIVSSLGLLPCAFSAPSTIGPWFHRAWGHYHYTRDSQEHFDDLFYSAWSCWDVETGTVCKHVPIVMQLSSARFPHVQGRHWKVLISLEFGTGKTFKISQKVFRWEINFPPSFTYITTASFCSQQTNGHLKIPSKQALPNVNSMQPQVPDN